MVLLSTYNYRYVLAKQEMYKLVRMLYLKHMRAVKTQASIHAFFARLHKVNFDKGTG